MLVFKNLEEMRPYYVEEINCYRFRENIKIDFDLSVNKNFDAKGIEAKNFEAETINAQDYFKAENVQAEFLSVFGDLEAKSVKVKYNFYAANIAAENIDAGEITAHSIAAKQLKAKKIDATNISIN